jgi:hypothetical protein
MSDQNVPQPPTSQPPLQPPPLSSVSSSPPSLQGPSGQYLTATPSGAPYATPPQAGKAKTNAARYAVFAVLVAVLLIGAFFGGMAATDPTDSDEYKSQTSKLEKAETDLASAQDEVTSVNSELDGSNQALAEAEAKVDALLSEAADDGVSDAEPAISGGAAVAPRNFRLDVRTRSKECYGSAGCNLTVQVDPNYVGKQDVSTGSWEITYELRGGEDGPVVETMTLEDGTFTFPEEQFLGTSSSSSQITAVVTEVYSLD